MKQESPRPLITELNEFDTDALLGRTAKLSVVHNENNGTVYANIGLIRPDKSDIVLKPSGKYVRVQDRNKDVCRAISLAIDWKGQEWTAFNIGTGTNHSVLETVKAAESFTGKTATIEHGSAHPADVPETLASPVKARNLLGWDPQVHFQHGPAPSLQKV